tara:strand:- start:776 stop:1015 length:240 start_codon:yes stop_codon:yes gene_type:complete
MSGDMEKLIEMLRHHDWTYEYSDDPGAWRRGHVSANAIKKASAKIGRPELFAQAFEEQKSGDLDWWLAELQEIWGENDA